MKILKLGSKADATMCPEFHIAKKGSKKETKNGIVLDEASKLGKDLVIMPIVPKLYLVNTRPVVTELGIEQTRPFNKSSAKFTFNTAFRSTFLTGAEMQIGIEIFDADVIVQTMSGEVPSAPSRFFHVNSLSIFANFQGKDLGWKRYTPFMVIQETQNTPQFILSVNNSHLPILRSTFRPLKMGTYEVWRELKTQPLLTTYPNMNNEDRVRETIDVLMKKCFPVN